jgi:repressor of nif and glnA expression
MGIESDRSGMAKEERKVLVLRLLAESNLALTPYVLFRNLKMRGATFERRTLGNYLRELVEDGFVERIEGDGDTLYQITDFGRERLEEPD